MKTFTCLSFLLLFWSCNQNPKNISGQNTNTNSNPTSYEFSYNGMTIYYNGNEKKQEISGRVLLFEKEVHIFRGNEGEKYFINKIINQKNELSLLTANNRGDKMNFRFFKVNNKSQIEINMNGTIANFNITKGDVSDIPFYGLQNNKVKTQDTSAIVKEKKTSENNVIKKTNCNCEKIKREDGTIVSECATLPVASDNSTQLGFAALSNGQEKFVSVTVRFKYTAQDITGNLTLRLEDNNLITMNLVNKGLSYIGNSQVAQAVFSTTLNQLKKIKSSSIKTISIKLGDGLIRTYKAEMNSDILQNQLLCL